ncbi:hypothetical protein C8R47DRAFT_225511 [Mycena vitilis]|nr:hypothetical protein C8R47DRAFT_225511 [Mycena vitilis]
MSRPRTRQALARQGRAWGEGSKAPPPTSSKFFASQSTSPRCCSDSAPRPAQPPCRGCRGGVACTQVSPTKHPASRAPPFPRTQHLQADTNGDKRSCGSSFPAQGSEGLALKLLREFPRRRRGGGGKPQRRTGRAFNQADTDLPRRRCPRPPCPLEARSQYTRRRRWPGPRRGDMGRCCASTADAAWCVAILSRSFQVLISYSRLKCPGPRIAESGVSLSRC